ncbi:MAG: electron transfer flavoprotein subunit beta/FixA family protein [Spirochaetes bacterium]|nr:electron transfer flavoprotein subunit beta/FixA family protein [Spirochaetota bacterium]
MKIVVFVKEVPDTEANIRINAGKNGIVEEGFQWITNPYDEFAIEEALKLKEKLGTGTVTVITVGGDRAETLLKADVLARGVDEAVIVNDPSLTLGNPLAAAAALAKAAQKVGFDIIFAGRTGIDYDYSAAPVMAAHFLGIPYATTITKFDISGTNVTVERDVEGGSETIALPAPCLLTCQKGLNEPRYPSLKGKMAAKKKTVAKYTLADLGVNASDFAPSYEAASFDPPAARPAGRKIAADDMAKAAAELVSLLKNEAKVI